MTHAIIRSATPADAARLAVLMQEFYAGEGLSYGPSAADALAALLAQPAFGHAWLFESAESDAGYMVLTWGYSLEFGGRFGLIDELYVRPANRTEGLGGRALRAAASACREAGAAALRLEVDHDNQAAARLYRRAGFQAHPRSIMTVLMEDERDD